MSAKTSRAQVLTSLHPWLAHVDLSGQWRGAPGEALLAALYTLTERHGAAHTADVKELWHMTVDRAANFSAVLDFVLQRVVEQGGTEGASASSTSSQVRASPVSTDLFMFESFDATTTEACFQIECHHRAGSGADCWVSIVDLMLSFRLAAHAWHDA